MKNLSPAQWRTLLNLFEYKQYVVYPPVSRIRADQRIGFDELVELDDARLIETIFGGKQAPLSRLSRSEGRFARLRLPRAGLRAVLETPLSQVVWMLGKAPGQQLTLEQIYRSSSVVRSELARLQSDELIIAVTSEGRTTSLRNYELSKADGVLDAYVAITLSVAGWKHFPK